MTSTIFFIGLASCLLSILWAWKWNSSDLHGRMFDGARCTAAVTGLRIPLLSTYRNILQVNCTEK